MINKKNIIYILLVIILLLVLCQNITYTEKYTIGDNNNKIITVPIYRYFQPWWNSTRHTRNMSYDIRGEIQNPINDIGLFGISPLL